MALISQIAGSILVVYAFLDLFLTILYARSGTGILAPYLTNGVWRIFRGAARVLSKYRDSILSYSGPTILVILSVVWALLYVVGFALICWPELGSAITASKGATPTDFTSALYYSGYTFTTLGTGDLVPQTGLYRVLMFVEAALGFSFFTLIITYILSIYETIRQRNAFALMLHHKTDATGDANVFISRMASGGNLSDVVGQIYKISEHISIIIEMHQLYPILHYFRFKKSYYAIPRMILIALDSASLIKSALDPEKHRAIVKSAAVSELWKASTHLIHTLTVEFIPDKYYLKRVTSDETIQQWRKHYNNLARKLSGEGIHTRQDVDAGLQEYISLRKEWNPYIDALSEWMLYEAEIEMRDSMLFQK